MKILTAAQMREVDRLTIEAGIPGIILMENAGTRVVDFLERTFAPLNTHRIVVVCGKGNNGGDGFVVARQLFTRKLAALQVIELFDPESLTGDAAAARKMLSACGCPVERKLPNELHPATLVVDAVLGTGLTGPAHGPALDGIRAINDLYAVAKKIAVDIPSGLPSDCGTNPTGEFVRADYTVSFTAAKQTQVFSPAYQAVGELRIEAIGTPDRFCETNPDFLMRLTTADDLRRLFAKRPADSNKGMYGHALVVGGAFGKSGAPSMAAVGSFRSGAGLVTVAIPADILPIVAAYRPELMTVAIESTEQILNLSKKMTVVALGPGIGTADETVRFVRTLYAEIEAPVVADADGLNCLAGDLPRTDKIRILTPHPGEMGRLTGKSVKEVQADRVGIAEEFVRKYNCCLVLKGDRTVIAFPDGETWINPTGSPSMATGGTGDILTGMISGLVAQHPKDWQRAVVAAVWLHGRCGELAERRLGQEATLATDLFDSLPEAIHELRPAV